MKRVGFILIVLLAALAAVAQITTRPTTPATTPSSQPANGIRANLPRFHRPSIADVVARPDARQILDALGNLKTSGPHIHPHPVYYVKRADGTIETRPITGPPAASQPSSGLAGAGQYPVPLPMPTDAGATRDLSQNILWSFPPQTADIQQWQTADCYFDSAVGGLNYWAPWYGRQLVHRRPDGLFDIIFHRGGRQVVTVNGLLPASTLGCQPNPTSGAIGMPLLEKAYCYFRSGANTYASLNYGYSAAAFSDLGCTGVYLSVDSHLPTALLATFHNGYPATLQTTAAAPAPFIASHVYFILTIEAIQGTNDAWLTICNPWGIDGGTFPADGNSGDGWIRVKQSTLAPYSQNVYAVTSFASDIPHPIPGDADLDGHVTINDMLILQTNFNQAGKTWTDGDFDGDGAVTISDFLMLQNNFNR